MFIYLFTYFTSASFSTPRNQFSLEFNHTTLIGKTFARETFAIFANFRQFRERLSRESFQNFNSRLYLAKFF